MEPSTRALIRNGSEDAWYSSILTGIRESTRPDLPANLDRSLQEQQQVHVVVLVGLLSDLGAVKHEAPVALTVEIPQAAIQISECLLKRPRLDVHTQKGSVRCWR